MKYRLCFENAEELEMADDQIYETSDFQTSVVTENDTIELWRCTAADVQSMAKHFNASAEVWDPIVEEWIDLDDSPLGQ